MFQFSCSNIDYAVAENIPAIEKLLNSAYRGEASKQGWTTEAALIQGDTRTDRFALQQVINQPGSIFLVYKDVSEHLIGCVNLQEHGEKLYLGMFSVSPQLQGGGIGKKLLLAAEEYGRHLGKTAIYMSVISVRSELVNWYIRHGYEDTGERKPFIEDGKTGKHLQPLEFMMLEKLL